MKKKRTSAVWGDLRAEYQISQWDAALLRVVEAAKKGGAAWADIVKVAERADWARRGLGTIHRSAVRVRTRSGTEYTRVPITEEERARYKAADKALRREYPVAAVRYRKIADDNKVKANRVDHVINGRRGRSKK